MMNRQIMIGLVFLLTLSTPGYGQSKKMIRDKGIISVTVREYFIEEGMDKPVVESVEKYNGEGELIEIQEFNRLGEMSKWEKYAYDEEGNLVEEVFLDQKGKVTRTEKSIYQEGLRVEKQFYNDRGRLYKKKEYLYEYHQQD
jgi:IMP dehydrogenase/GMP reductase